MLAASATPQGLPRPPRMRIETRTSESPKVKLFGATKPFIIPYTDPATPAMKLPRVKARIFQRAASMPNTALAVSSKRTASRLRPTQERSRRRTTANASAASPSASTA